MEVVVLVGMPASGKSAVGAHVAASLGLTFVDLDARVAEATGMPVAALLKRDGEASMRLREAEELDRALAAPGPQLIAAGGGTPCFHEGMTRMLARARVVWLDAPVETLVERTLQDAERPLLGHTRLEQTVALRDLAARRSATYARAHLRVDATAPVPAVVRQVQAALRPQTELVVAFAQHRHPLIVHGGGAGDAAEAVAALATDGRKIALVVDRKARSHAEPLQAMLAARGLAVHLIEVPGGEKSKDLRMVAKLWQDLAARGFGRSDLLVGLGGGATTDLTGFVAATWLRGVRWVALPTTVLAMADASVGGKTAIDLAAGKNLVGAFHPPVLVVLCLGTLSTLPGPEWRSGLAEIAKVFLAGDAAAWRDLIRDAPALRRRSTPALEPHLLRAVAQKAAIVERDPRDEGERNLLNLGHTLGHALEADSGYTLRHGEAVALGMVAAADVSVALGEAPLELAAQVRAGLQALDLPTAWEPLATPSVLGRLAQDKKMAGEGLRFVALGGLGAAAVRPMPLAALQAMLGDLAMRAPPVRQPRALALRR